MTDKIIEKIKKKKLENLKLCVYPAHDELDKVANETVEACNIGLDDAINIVKQVAEEHKGGWIKCSDEIPDSEVIACNTHGTQMIGYICENTTSDTGYKCESGSEHMLDCIAWMPKLQPYKKPKPCKWLHNEACCNNESDECADFPSEEVCLKCRHREVD